LCGERNGIGDSSQHRVGALVDRHTAHVAYAQLAADSAGCLEHDDVR
jgi:hypothetical protein